MLGPKVAVAAVVEKGVDADLDKKGSMGNLCNRSARGWCGWSRDSFVVYVCERIGGEK